MSKFKKVNNQQGEVDSSLILRTTDNAYIPFDPANTDYQEYLEWLSEGNTAEPADEPTPE